MVVPFLAPSAFIAEFVIDGIRMKFRAEKLNLVISIEATSISLANDLGRIAEHFKHFIFARIAESFDYMTRKHILCDRKAAGMTFFVFVLLVVNTLSGCMLN